MLIDHETSFYCYTIVNKSGANFKVIIRIIFPIELNVSFVVRLENDRNKM